MRVPRWFGHVSRDGMAVEVNEKGVFRTVVAVLLIFREESLTVHTERKGRSFIEK